MRRASKLKWAAFIAVDLALAVTLVFLFLVNRQANQLEQLADLGTNLLPQPRAIRPFLLESNSGEIFSEERLLGRWSFVFYGFTNCPNICPMTMAELGQFYRQLQAQTNELDLPQVIMATVDPQRDTAETLSNYLADFDASFVGLTGDDRQLSKLAEQLFVVSNTASDHGEGHGDMPMPETSTGEQLFDHSGHISVINPAGEIFAVMRLPHRDQDILAAYEILVRLWP